MKKLEVSLSKNDLEHIANGYDIKIKIGDRRILEVDEIILKPALTKRHYESTDKFIRIK